MRMGSILLLTICFVNSNTQPKVYEARYLHTQPVFPAGVGSCERFYFTHFKGFDSVLYKAIAYGDTAKYLRIYFSFVIDKNGVAHNAHFEKIASTQYAKGITSKTIRYFSGNEKYFDKLIKDMIDQMPFWKPGLLYARPVDCKVETHFQFWVGLNAPSN
jgi:hypothetical protein